MKGAGAIFRRELAGYFETPLAYVFIVIFLFLSGVFTFYVGNFFGRGQADLVSFFTFHPWLYLLLIPAVSMRIWAEERKSGTIELLLTLPVSITGAVVGKFLAAWAFTAVAVALTFPLWITVSILGDPDHGVIVASYIGSLMMAGGYLAIGSCLSATTENQVIAFVLALTVSLIFTIAGHPFVVDFLAGRLPEVLVETIASFSFFAHFQAIITGVLDARDFLFFGSLIAVWLFAAVIVVNVKKAG